MIKKVDEMTGAPIIGFRIDDLPRDERDHFYRCPHCGQLVDRRDLGAVMHHEQKDHNPLPDDEASLVVTRYLYWKRQAEDESWEVFNTSTGLTISMEGHPLTGLDQHEVNEVIGLLNAGELLPD